MKSPITIYSRRDRTILQPVLSQGRRRLAAIMFTDMVGYTALTQSSESLAMEVLQRHNRLLRPIFPKFRGSEVKTIGDSFLVEFDSALNAVRCAVEIQTFLHDYNVSSKDEWKIKLRIGIHLGDVIHQRADILGDAVNIASRIEPIAEPEGICISEQVYDQVHNKFELPILPLGDRPLKNVNIPTAVFRVGMPWEEKSRSSSLDAHRIAVMPFVNMSPDPSDEYFADGMTEELISSISNINGLSVISRTSVMKFKGGGKTVAEIGQELKAGTLLEGSVRKADNFVRVSAQLIDVNNDQHLWAEKYDRELKNIFALQSEIAKQVADSLRVRIVSPELARIERKPTENTTAYTLYLKGRYLWNKRSLEDTKKAIECFEQARTEDPSFAPSYLGLADCFLVLRDNWLVDIDINRQKAEIMLAKAVELDPGLAEAHATMGRLLVDDYHLAEAEKKYKKAIELKPSYAFAHMWYSNMLMDQQRLDEGLSQLERALELDPLSPVINNNHAWYFFHKKDYNKALEVCERVSKLNPNYLDVYFTMAFTLGKMNRFDDSYHAAEIAVNRLQSIFPLIRKTLEIYDAYIRGGKDRVKRLLPDLEAHLEAANTSAVEMAGFYFYVGEVDKGFEWLERSYSRREYLLLGIKGNFPIFDYVPRHDSRYLDLLRRLGLND